MTDQAQQLFLESNKLRDRAKQMFDKYQITRDQKDYNKYVKLEDLSEVYNFAAQFLDDADEGYHRRIKRITNYIDEFEKSHAFEPNASFSLQEVVQLLTSLKEFTSY